MARPIVLLAHGAGAPSSSPWMRRWASLLSALGDVVPFDYPYMRAGRKTPDRLPALVDAHRAALEGARQIHGPDRSVVLAGKSMGSRVGCHLAVALADAPDDLPPPRALVCFGYPLRAAGSGALRDQVLLDLKTPVLFLQGSRDPLCPLPDLEAVRARMKAPSSLFVVEDGDHGLEVRKRVLAAQGRTQDAWDEAVLEAVRRFLDEHLPRGPA